MECYWHKYDLWKSLAILSRKEDLFNKEKLKKSLKWFFKVSFQFYLQRYSLTCHTEWQLCGIAQTEICPATLNL